MSASFLRSLLKLLKLGSGLWPYVFLLQLLAFLVLKVLHEFVAVDDDFWKSKKTVDFYQSGKSSGGSYAYCVLRGNSPPVCIIHTFT